MISEGPMQSRMFQNVRLFPGELWVVDHATCLCAVLSHVRHDLGLSSLCHRYPLYHTQCFSFISRFPFGIVSTTKPFNIILGCKMYEWPVPVAARSEAWVCWPPAYWDCGFESHRRHECLFVVSVVCCQVEVSATG